MWKKTAAILGVALVVSSYIWTARAQAENNPTNQFKYDVFKVSVAQQYETVRPCSESAIALDFEIDKNWHFYASAKTAPGGMNLKFKPSGQKPVNFLEFRFPESEIYFDDTVKKELEVFSNKFTVFLPFSISEAEFETDTTIPIKISIEGAYCSAQQCRIIQDFAIDTKITISSDATMKEAKFVLPEITAGTSRQAGQWVNLSAWFALGLAFLAGLSLNIMPCVWPVLPLIVMRIIEQAKESKGKSITMGLAFCLGILLFFACLAGANIILQVFYGTVLQWGDQFRNPGFVAGMALLLVVLALFMFGVFTITVPSAISSKSGSGKGYSGAVGMGFLAAVLSTPCSFAILAAAFAWAQAQPLPLATLAIIVIGVGMSAPYAILTSMPGLLKHTPKPGRWMELFKQAIGFVLLIIAVKLISAIPQVQRMNILYFAVTLGFCIWMWGSWVSYNTKLPHKFIIRIIAVVIAVAAGMAFLPAPAEELIDWQKYDTDVIETALAENRPVLIKFTADWCLSCQVVEKTVYSKEDIAKLIQEKGVLAIKADTTVKDYPATLALKNKFKEPGVPVSMLFAPGGKEPVRWRGLNFADELKIQLENLPSE